MRVFDDIVDALSDGKYHTFEDIQLTLKYAQPKATHNLDETQIELVLSILSTAGFIRRLHKPYSSRTWKARLEPQMLDFLKRIKDREDWKDKEMQEAKIGIAKESET